jgi:hypothetical protein
MILEEGDRSFQPLNIQGSQNGFLLIWAGCCSCNLIVVFLRFCKCVEVDCIFPMSRYTQFLDSWFKSYGVLKISALLWAGWLSATVNAANSAQNCPKLPKVETLKFHQKSRF